MGMSIILQVFGYKPKYWMNYNFELVTGDSHPGVQVPYEESQYKYAGSWDD